MPGQEKKGTSEDMASRMNRSGITAAVLAVVAFILGIIAARGG